MFLAGSNKKPQRRPTAGADPVSPFDKASPGANGPVGPGVGAADELFTEALARRRRWAAHTLGETPPRDGPFAAAAADIAIKMPPRARQAVRKRTAGLNPFQDS